MSDQTAPIFLRYSFDKAFEDKYQGIYYAHFHGSTLAIGAKFKAQRKGNKIDSLEGDFISQIPGGKINFALDSIDSKTTYDKDNNRHLLKIKINIFKKEDQDFDTTVISFKPAFDMTKDTLRIQILDDDIENLEDGMINDDVVQIDDFRSCDIGLI